MSHTSTTVGVMKRDFEGDELLALQEFANLSDDPAEWQKFREHWPRFFLDEPVAGEPKGPNDLTEWLYRVAEDWANYGPEIKARTRPPLLWYRDHLRAVWTHNDREGVSLPLLLGFEKKALAAAKADNQ